MNNPNAMTMLLLFALCGGGIAALCSQPEEQAATQTRPVVLHMAKEPDSDPDMQRLLMDQLDRIDSEQAKRPAKLFHPRNAKERAAAIAAVWSLDTTKSLKLAMR